MRPWLLLLSLLVSDLSPLGDGDGVMENYSWSLYRKLLLNGQMSPRGPEILQTQTEHCCVFTRRNCVYVAVQHKQRTSPSFFWAYTVHVDHGCCLSHQEFTGIIHRKHTPALVIKLLRDEGKSIPAFLLKSDTLPALRVMSKIRPTEAGGKTSHIGLNILKDLPDTRSAWSLHHHAAASGHNIQAFSLEKSKSWAPATIVQKQKMLTKRCCVAATVIIPCCFERGETRSALKIKKVSKQQMVQAQIRRKQSTQTAMDIKAGRSSSKAAPLHSVKSSDISELQIQRRAVRVIKKNELFNLDKQQKSVQRQRSLRAVCDDDGFFVKRQHSLVPREKTASINRLKYKMRAARDDNKEDFSGKIITKQAEFRRPEGGSETGQSAIENGEQGRLAYIRRADLTHKADDNDVDREQMLTEVLGEVLIMLFLPDAETQTEPSLRKNLIPNTDTGWKTVNIPIKELGDPLPMTKVLKENFIFQPDNSKCKCLKEIQFLLEIYALDRTERMNLKPAESAAKVTTAPAKTAGEVTEGTATSSTPPGDMSINQTKQEEGVPSEESVIPSPPSLKTTETETVTAEQTAETTTANMEIKETASSTEVFNQGSTQTAGRQSTEETPTTRMSPESETEPRYITRNKNNNTQATTQTSFFGLGMREDVPKDTTKLHKGAESEETNRPGYERNEDPKGNSFAFPSQTIHKQDADKLLKTTDDNTPLCRGLIHRTDAGWKHCVERFAGAGSKTFSSQEHTDGEQEHTSIGERADSDPDDDEYDHFYYFDGKLRRVQKNFYPYHKGQRRQRSTDDSEFRARRRRRGDTHENLLGYIRQLALRNKASRFK